MIAMPYISFYCSCGTSVYSVSTNVGGLVAKYVCPCGKRYECEHSLIASAVEEGDLAMPAESQPIRNHAEFLP
jgi:hypothetical protein